MPVCSDRGQEEASEDRDREREGLSTGPRVSDVACDGDNPASRNLTLALWDTLMMKNLSSHSLPFFPEAEKESSCPWPQVFVYCSFGSFVTILMKLLLK